MGVDGSRDGDILTRSTEVIPYASGDRFLLEGTRVAHDTTGPRRDRPRIHRKKLDSVGRRPEPGRLKASPAVPPTIQAGGTYRDRDQPHSVYWVLVR